MYHMIEILDILRYQLPYRGLLSQNIISLNSGREKETEKKHCTCLHGRKSTQPQLNPEQMAKSCFFYRISVFLYLTLGVAPTHLSCRGVIYKAKARIKLKGQCAH